MKARTKKLHRATAAAGLFDELIVDLFAGGGGASMGIERAFGRAVDVAINHDVEAVAMHKANHPHTYHSCQNVRRVSPVKATGSRPVGLLWLSPDCCHFSIARGFKPVKKKIRGLANVAIRWAKAVRPRVIMLENVREFTTWGPCLSVKDANGQVERWPDGTAKMVPDPKRKGRTFEAWKAKLRAEGYKIEHRVLNAADYGAATHRRRFFLIARCDGQPIVWPEPTHGPGRAHPYRAAADFIDWTIPIPSIFLTREEGKAIGVKRPLAEKTLARIAKGIFRYVIDSPRPYIVRCNHGGNDFRGQSMDEPLGTLTSKNGYGVAAPFCTAQFGERDGQEPRTHSIAEPIPTVTPRGGGGFPLVAAHLTRYFGGERQPVGKEVSEPLPTVTSVDHHAVVAASLSQFNKGCVGRGVDEPGPTVMAQNNHTALLAANLIQYNTEQSSTEVRGSNPAEPIKTITAEPRFAVAASNLIRLGQHGGNGAYVNQVDQPLTTVVSKAEHCVTAAFVARQGQGDKPCDAVDEPARTIRAQGKHHSLVAAQLAPQGALGPLSRVGQVRSFLLKYYGSNVGASLFDPLHTVTSKDRFGLVMVGGKPHQISDIGLRMLTPRELFGCQGFPPDYILNPVVKGRPLPKDAQTRMVGNSVPPQLSEALVRANFADECVPPVTTSKPSRRQAQALRA